MRRELERQVHAQKKIFFDVVMLDVVKGPNNLFEEYCKYQLKMDMSQYLKPFYENIYYKVSYDGCIIVRRS